MSAYELVLWLAGVGALGVLLGGIGDRLIIRARLSRLVREREIAQQRLEAVGHDELADMIRGIQHDRGEVDDVELVWLVTATGVLLVALVVVWRLGLLA